MSQYNMTTPAGRLVAVDVDTEGDLDDADNAVLTITFTTAKGASVRLEYKMGDAAAIHEVLSQWPLLMEQLIRRQMREILNDLGGVE